MDEEPLCGNGVWVMPNVTIIIIITIIIITIIIITIIIITIIIITIIIILYYYYYYKVLCISMKFRKYMKILIALLPRYMLYISI